MYAADVQVVPAEGNGAIIDWIARGREDFSCERSLFRRLPGRHDSNGDLYSQLNRICLVARRRQCFSSSKLVH